MITSPARMTRQTSYRSCLAWSILSRRYDFEPPPPFFCAFSCSLSFIVALPPCDCLFPLLSPPPFFCAFLLGIGCGRRFVTSYKCTTITKVFWGIECKPSGRHRSHRWYFSSLFYPFSVPLCYILSRLPSILVFVSFLTSPLSHSTNPTQHI